VSGAEVLIMDEPTSELDERAEVEVLHHLARLARDDGKTVLLACHALDHVAALAERVCHVDHGRVQTVRTEDLVSGGAWRLARAGGGTPC